MPDNFLWDVFLSHNRKDKTRVRQVAERLRAAGLRVWFDEWIIQPGDDIYAGIEHGLEYTRTLILCMSRAAFGSDWVKLERNTSIFRDPMNKDRRLIPLLLEDCKIPVVLRRLSYLDWRSESDEVLAQLVQSCQPPKQKAQTRSQRRRTSFALPTGTISSDNPLYIEREADAYAMAAAQHAAETIVIRAPRQMGKSSLLKRYRSACEQTGKRFALLDLFGFTDEEMTDYPTFLTTLAQELWEELGQPQRATPPRLHNQREVTKYLERSLLAAISEPVVIAFDEMDRVLGRAYQNDFAAMLRLWHERRAVKPIPWAKTGLAVVTSTEPYLFIKDVLRSPFNVGLQIELRLFNETECGKLNRLYRARLNQPEINQLMELLNGHPYLTHLAFYSLTGPNPLDFSTILQWAAERSGPFGSHLRALENQLMDEAGEALIVAMKQIIDDGKAPSRDAFYRLQGAGLVREDDDRMVPANQLYARFFGKLR